MLEKPDLPDQILIDHLSDDYGLSVRQLDFLPLGADVHTAVYRVETGSEEVFFLKLRSGPFDEITVSLPRFLHDQGIRAVIAPLETRQQRLWVDLETYKMILYPFVAGQDGYQVSPSEPQWKQFGAALSMIHHLPVPPALARRIPREAYSPEWRETVRACLLEAKEQVFEEPVAQQFAALVQAHRPEIEHMLLRAEQLAASLRSRGLPFVLCHSDIHPGNLHIPPGSGAPIYIVDWDNPIFAPKERDLMMIGGCPAWNDPLGQAWFYENYRSHPPGLQPAEVDLPALAYYRYERIIWDVAAYSQELLHSNEGRADRAQSLRYFASNFLPGNTLDLALQADSLLPGRQD